MYIKNKRFKKAKFPNQDIQFSKATLCPRKTKIQYNLLSLLYTPSAIAKIIFGFRNVFIHVFYVPLKICQTKSDKPGLELSKQIL